MGERFTAPQGLGHGYCMVLVRALEHYRMLSPVYSVGPPAHPLAQGCVMLKLMSTEPVMPSNHLIFYHPLLLLPMKCPFLKKQKQISFGSSFRSTFPHSAQLSSLMEPGTQPKRSCLIRLSK